MKKLPSLSRLILAVLGGFVLLGVNSPTSAAEFKMRIAGAASAGDIRYEAVDFLAREIPKATGGRVEVEVFKGTIGSERELMERLTLGTLEAYMGSTGPLQQTTGEPVASLYDVPYLFKDWDHLYRVAKSDIGNALGETVAKRGVRILDYVSMGTRAVYTREKPIRVPSDLEGLKIRVMENPVYIAMYKEFGAIPVPMAWGEIYTSLQTGVLDGVDGSLSSGLSSKHTESVKYVTFLANHVVIASIIAVSEPWWKKLPADLRQQISKVTSEAAAYEQKKNDQYQGKLRQEWRDAGVTFTESDRNKFETLAQRVYPMVEEKIGKDVIEKIIAMGK